MSPEALTLVPLGVVRGGRSEAVDDGWSAVEATIVLDGDLVDPSATRGLDAFSHLEVVFRFHLVDPDSVTNGARRPRGRVDLPEIGILAQRAKGRPNRLGLSRCQLLEVRCLELDVRGLDAVDGSPVLDVKPYLRQFGPRGPLRQPLWTDELMSRYW